MTPTHQALALATRAGLSGVDIARICGVSTVTVSRWRAGTAPKLDVIAPLLVELDLLDAAVGLGGGERVGVSGRGARRQRQCGGDQDQGGE